MGDLRTNPRKVFTPDVLVKLFHLIAREGTISAACRDLGIAPVKVYNLIAEDREFAAKIKYAKEIGIEALEDELHRRAFRGDVVVTKDGASVKYSDTLGMFLMKGAKPDKYRERVSQDVNSKGSVQIQVITGIGEGNADTPLPAGEATPDTTPVAVFDFGDEEELPDDGSDLV